MKTIKFLSAIALVAALASCSEDLPNPDPQQYPNPDGVFANSDLTLEQGDVDQVLQKANEANVNCVLATVTDLKNFPEGYTLSVDAQVSGTEDFAKYETISTIMEDKQIAVNPDVMNGAIQAAITMVPEKLPVYVRYQAYAERGNTRILLGGKDHKFGPYKYEITPLAPAVELEQEYYLVGSFCNWDITKALKFSNTKPGINAYDNPNFSIVVDVTEAQAAAGYEWMVIPASTYTAKDFAAGAFGVRADETGNSGILVNATKAGESAGVIKNYGPQLISINMYDKTYRVNYALDVVWAFTANNNAMGLYSDDFISFTGVAVFTTVARFGQEPNNKGVMFRQEQDSEATEKDGVFSGALTSSGGKDIRVAKGAGLYWCDINLGGMTYQLTHLTSVSVVGAGNGWNEKDTETMLTPSKDFKKWTGKNIQIGKDGDTSFKLNCNHAWDIDFGGTKDESVIGGAQTFNLQMKGANMQADGEGKYDVEVNFATVPYTVTLTKK